MSLIKEPRIKDETHLKRWLIRVAINKCKDLNKSSARRRTVALETVIEKYNLNDDDTGVLDCINELAPLDRDIIYLHYYEGFSAKEIGGIVGKKENAIFTRLKRVRIKLKDMLEEGENEEI